MNVGKMTQFKSACLNFSMVDLQMQKKSSVQHESAYTRHCLSIPAINFDINDQVVFSSVLAQPKGIAERQRIVSSQLNGTELVIY